MKNKERLRSCHIRGIWDDDLLQRGALDRLLEQEGHEWETGDIQIVWDVINSYRQVSVS